MGFNYGYEKKKFDSRWKRLEVESVSYTHLDVYKRQSLHWLNGSPRDICGGRSGRQLYPLRCASPPEKMTGRSETCLLYTSDVTEEDNMASLYLDLQKLNEQGYKYIFIDEITKAEQFVRVDVYKRQP